MNVDCDVEICTVSHMKEDVQTVSVAGRRQSPGGQQGGRSAPRPPPPAPSPPPPSSARQRRPSRFIMIYISSNNDAAVILYELKAMTNYGGTSVRQGNHPFSSVSLQRIRYTLNRRVAALRVDCFVLQRSDL